MPYYSDIKVEKLYPQHSFVCDCCGKPSAEINAKRKFKVRFKMLDGTKQNFCIKCATKVTNRPHVAFSKNARHLYSVDELEVGSRK